MKSVFGEIMREKVIKIRKEMEELKAQIPKKAPMEMQELTESDQDFTRKLRRAMAV